MPNPLVKTLYEWSEIQPEAPAYSYWAKGDTETENLNYGEFLNCTLGLAHQIQSQFPHQSRLMLLFEPGLEFCIAFWACLLSGTIAVPVYPPGDPRTRERFLGIAKDAQAAGVLTTQKLKTQSTLVRWLMGSLRRMHWMAIDPLLSSTQPLPLPLADEIALLQYTSGSTADPKGVILTHHNLWANSLCLNAARQTGVPPGFQDSFVSWLPLYHDMGLMTGVIFPIVLGSYSTLLSPLHFLQKPLRWLQALSQTRATISAAPNFAFEICLKRINPEQRDSLDLSAWQVALNGAETIRPETLERFQSYFSPCGLKPQLFYPCYGLAESTVFVTGGLRHAPPQIENFSRHALQNHQVAPPKNAEDSYPLVAVGQAWADTKICIVNPTTGQKTSDHEVGEIWIQGNSVGQGYWGQTALSQNQFYGSLAGENWLRSGDLGFIQAGQLYITGRLKEIMILQGQNYYPQTFEQLCENAHPALRPGCCAAFSIGEPETVVLVQEIRKGTITASREIEAAIRETIALRLGIPVHEIVLIAQGELPKTSSGKIQRSRTRQKYLQGKLKKWKK